MGKVAKTFLCIFVITFLLTGHIYAEEEKDLNPQQLRDLITDVLMELDLYCANARELLMLTAAQESHLGHYIKQVGNGPARGIFQMEPSTEKDIWENFLKYKPDLSRRIVALMGEADWENLQLTGNLLYQIAMARIHYYRRPEALPYRGNIISMAQYWKAHYNTHLGKGTIAEAIKNYKRLAKPGIITGVAWKP
ncbi:hypothetical protein KAR91_65420 [Candidatus Pacearchaeota archaeon]|nr:hypothetical protein [Candidatus Pacearchaeota archaeon]